MKAQLRHCLLLVALGVVPFLTAQAATFGVKGVDPAPWKKILGSVGIGEARQPEAEVMVVGGNSQADIAALAERHLVIVEGVGVATERLGFKANAESVAVRQICDSHGSEVQIIWEKPVTVPAVELAADFQVFAKEKWKGIPVLAGKRTARGGILWIATPPGASGIERYPYLLQAAVDIGLTLPVRSTTLWAFFDSAYRIRADADYLAQRWREAGISVLHVAAWHNIEADPVQDAFLRKLIEACHNHAILVYAWLELPHVSEKFWADHPAWREKTGLLQDAQLDWRKLMNLQNPECRRDVEKEVGTLLGRFDWDGVNLAELYFESLEGVSNPARFTPMNDDVRAEFGRSAGWDPRLLFDPTSPYAAEKNAPALRSFLEFRADLASRMQAEWLAAIDRQKQTKPYLDVVLTHIDDRFEPGMRDALGADVARVLPLMNARHGTLLVEDPAPLWSLGPERYAKLGSKYRELAGSGRDIAIDINVVDRYQDVYPTKKQTGVELLELVHEAAASFSRVALYFENSLEKQDLPLLPAAATAATAINIGVDEIETNAPQQTRIAWQGPVELDGKLWPVQDARYVLAPAGKHRLSPAMERSSLTAIDFNGELQSAAASKDRVDLSYASRSRAILTLDQVPAALEVDGVRVPQIPGRSILLPAGEHIVGVSR